MGNMKTTTTYVLQTLLNTTCLLLFGSNAQKGVPDGRECIQNLRSFTRVEIIYLQVPLERTSSLYCSAARLWYDALQAFCGT